MNCDDDRYSHRSENQVDLAPGDQIRVELPFSEAMMAARKAGQVWTVHLGNTSAQLIDAGGDEWGGPYLPSECGIYSDRVGGRDVHYAYGVKVARESALRVKLTRALAGATELNHEHTAEYAAKFDATERMPDVAQVAYWAGYYAGQADAFRTAQS